MNAEWIAKQLGKAKRSGKGWVCCCPSHEDHNPSLSLMDCDNGKILVTCHAGCSQSNVMGELKRKCLWPEKQGGKTTDQTWDYVDINGNIVSQKIRYTKRDGSKSYYQQRPDGMGGWIKESKSTCLYNLPKVIEGVKAGRLVFLVEGEKCADALIARGLCATTSGSNTSWRDKYVEVLKDAAGVVILPDNDIPGRNYANIVARALHKEKTPIYMIELEGLPDKGDVFDWFSNGHSKEELIELVEKTTEFIPKDEPEEKKDNVIDFRPEDYLDTEFANSDRFVSQHKDIVYKTEVGWLIWDSKRYKLDQLKKVQELARSTIEMIAQEAKEDRTLQIWAKKSRTHKAIASTLGISKSAAAMSIAYFDSKPYLLNVRNGVINLKTGELFEHSKELLMTRLLDIDYDPRARCLKWIEFLNWAMRGNQEMVSFLQRFVGYCLTGDTSEQVFAFLHGEGENGKSKFMERIVKLMGEYCTSADKKLVMINKHDTKESNPSKIVGARFVNISSEVDDRDRLDEAKIKQLTGEDTITASKLWRDPFDFTSQAKIMMRGNSKPTIADMTKGMWRRVLLIPFEAELAPGQRDKKLDEKFDAEMKGILAWAVQGCLDWQKIGLNPPEKIIQATLEYKSEMDVLGDWISTRAEVGDKCYSESASDLYTDYAQWCKATGHREMSQRKFSSHLKMRGFKNDHTRTGNLYIGIRLKINKGESNYAQKSIGGFATRDAYEDR
jgi:putative DNA primase/helicase